MSRADRLYDLIQILRDGRLHRAVDLATDLGVTERTIWRDMATLMASGLPVEGERGVGYLLRAPITLPPIMLSTAELNALRAGLGHVAAGSDAALARAARSLAARIASVIPAASFPDDEDLFVFSGDAAARPVAHLPILHRAIRDSLRLRLTHLDPQHGEEVIAVVPLALQTEGQYRILVARAGSGREPRRFRVDRIVGIAEADGGSSRLSERPADTQRS